ncbi:hypothetical protein [Lyngbya sp. PCC 8106]|uniref:hypothetical protein n=1 Tax=Lyngbya sp. (strain PCC 8106) TaxID=313612 RepID=UPI0000EA9762|nr:hypothetical protein [Lyngbya sp. PCC 8106]EAW34220.1 hypothetical protein L8106_08936 [Lyngbya sp. PCC 8106]
MARKLAYIQEITEQDVLEVIPSSIEIHYQQLQQQAEPNLAEKSEAILSSIRLFIF